MKSEVVLLYWEDLNASELNAMKIIKFMGGTVKLVRLINEGLADEESFKTEFRCLITSAQTLSKLGNESQGGVELKRRLMNLASNVLIYGFESTPSHNVLLQRLSSGGLVGVQSVNSTEYEFRVAMDARKICRQFTGLSFRIATPETITVFREGKGESQISSLIRLGERPFFVSAKDGGGNLLLLANQQIADLDAIVPSDSTPLQYFSGLVPLMMFISNASSNSFWHNDKPTACFIVDDPLLKQRYGFLEYPKLLEVMQHKRFCTSIAFIPWNYRRSSRFVVDLFTAYPDKYSVCVHGCDHMAAEFGSSSYPSLREKAQKGLDRMMLHYQLSGLPFDDVMVFPQGVFSTVAIKALKSCGYLAAVNSSVHANDFNDTFTLKDLVDVAVMRFSNFPLFIRHYPMNLAALAFDLFLGKPALLVEHHNYFRNGYSALAEFIDRLNSLDERLEWTNLGEICSRVCLKRVSESGDLHVKFFTNRFWMQNDSGRPQKYALFRQQSPDDHPLEGVTINGCHVDYTQEANYIQIPLSLGAGETADIRFLPGDLDPVSVPCKTTRVYDSRVFIRRSLSEFRDNYVERNRYLNITASRYRNLFTRSEKKYGNIVIV